MDDGDGKHFVLLHLFTEYKITDKPISDMTPLQYQAILIIAEQIMKYKHRNKPLMVI